VGYLYNDLKGHVPGPKRIADVISQALFAPDAGRIQVQEDSMTDKARNSANLRARA
jgi:hypothetical protein